MMIRSALSGLAALAALPAVASAQDSPVSLEAETQVLSTHVNRGVRQYVNPTDPSSQTGVKLGLEAGPGTISIGAWNATALAHFDDQDAAALEFAATGGYSVAVEEILTVGLEYVAHLYPLHDPVDPAHELVATAAVDTWFQPRVLVAVEFVRIGAVYASAGIGHDLTLVEDVLTVGARLSFGVAAEDGAPFHIHDVVLATDGRWTFAEQVYLHGTVSGNYDAVPTSVQGRTRSVGSRFTLVAGLGIGVEL
jgi:hypothetical protein